MGRRHEQTFFQRRHPDDQQTHEKMLNITSSGKCKSKPRDTTSQWLKSTRQEATGGVGEDAEKSETSCTVGGWQCKMLHLVWKTVWRFNQKIKNKNII